MTKTAKKQLKKNNTKKMKGGEGGMFGNVNVSRSEDEILSQKVSHTPLRDKPKEDMGIIHSFKGFFGLNNKPESNTQEQTGETSEPTTLNGGRRRNTKKATRKAKKGGRFAKKGARKANKSRRTRK